METSFCGDGDTLSLVGWFGGGRSRERSFLFCRMNVFPHSDPRIIVRKFLAARRRGREASSLLS